MMRTYRLYSFGRAVAPPRATHTEAIKDARRLGLAAWDGERREHYVPVPAEIRVIDEP